MKVMEKVLLVFFLDMFKLVCLIIILFVVWCMYEKLEINVLFVEEFIEVVFNCSWIIVFMFVIFF